MTSPTRKRQTLREEAALDPVIVSPIDGLRRKQSDEDKLDDMFFSYFNNHVGEQIMRYMRNLFTNTALPMGTTGEQALHREGSRFSVTIMEARRQAGENKQHPRSENES